MLKQLAKVCVGALALLGLIVVVLNVIGPETVFKSSCSSITLRETQSPGGEFTAAIVSSTCEDLSRSGVDIYLRRSSDRDVKRIRISDNSSTEFEMTWVSNEQLEVSGPAGLYIGETIGELYGVWIRYRATR